MQQDQAHLPTMAPRLTITVEEAAVALGISRTLAYEALHRGELPFIRIGRRILSSPHSRSTKCCNRTSTATRPSRRLNTMRSLPAALFGHVLAGFGVDWFRQGSEAWASRASWRPSEKRKPHPRADLPGRL